MKKSLCDTDMMLSHFGGDEEILVECISQFLIVLPKVILEIQLARDQCNWERAYVEIHKLGGMVSIFFSEDLTNTIKMSEKLAKLGKGDELFAQFALLKEKLLSVESELKGFLVRVQAC